MPRNLDPRLMRCAGLVSNGGVALDIGTDHAYLACFLIESGRCRHVYAADIADGPLNAARQTVHSLGLEDRVTVVKSDGLKDLPDEALSAATDVVIAGMGGELIAEILSHSEKLPKDVNLILQPNTRAQVLRRFLYAAGYEILHESAVRDGRFIYTVINAKYCGEEKALSVLESAVGKLDPNNKDSREYLENEISRLRAAAEGMAASMREDNKPDAELLRDIALEIEDYIRKCCATQYS